jgi:iron complex outermembrane receptor protein
MKVHSKVRQHRQHASFSFAIAFGLLLSTALTPTSAFAQAVANADDNTQLQEIIVTAQRREQNLQDTPVAVSAFDGQSLLASGVSNIRDLAHVDPSLNIPRVAGVYLPFLRGVGNGAGGNVGNESSVPVYIDDLYYTRLSTAYLALGSIDRVEVLKGPQGTLFGRNSSGGAIQMFTKDPGRDTVLNVTVGYANYDTFNGQIYASTPITDTLAWNISAGGSDQRNGWGKSITTGQDAFKEKSGTVRSKLLWEPSSGTRVKIVGFYAYSKGDIGLNEDRHTGTFGSSAALPAPGYPAPPIILPSLADVPGGHFYDTRTNFRQYMREKGYGASIRIDQTISFADLVSITGFRNSKGLMHTDSDYSAQDFYNADLGDIDRQITQEFQLKSKKASKIDWILGAFYLHAQQGYDPTRVYGDILNFAVAPGTVQDIFSRQTINSYSIYGQTTVPIEAKTNLTLGLRFTDDKVSGNGQQTLTIPGVGTIPAAPDFSDSKTFKRLTWKGAVDHHFTDNIMGYASVSRGYKSGTFNALPLDRSPAMPEIVDAYEIGVKSELFDRRVRLNGALFWNDIKDPQVFTLITTGIVSGVGLTNAQKARVKGGEIGFEAVAAGGLTLRGAATYLDAKYVNFIDAPFYSQSATTITGPVLGDASGNRLPSVPKWRFDIGANYTVDTSIGALAGDVSASYTGRFAWNADNRVFEKAVTLVNASLNFTPTSLNWMTIGLWGKNLGGIEYYSISQEFVGPLSTGGDTASPASPRTFGGSISVKY